ncbi:MAG TPA: hypothetical protein PLX77_00120 [Candidatus Cloacimonadota bacterium]|nr:hypothetical protein [Candidatus Cloacimonadota bacterium]
MRKIALLLFIMGVMIGSLSASEEQLQFRLLQPEEYNLTISISTVINRFYASAEFVIDVDNLAKADYYSFFISKQAYLERIKIDGKSVPFSYTWGLDPRHFEPVLTMEDLVKPDGDEYCISLSQDVFKGKKGQVTISMSYKMMIPDSVVTDDGRTVLEWNSRDCFYPRNPEQNSAVNIDLLTTVFYTVDNPLSVSDQGDIRRIKLRLVDTPQDNAKLTLYKVLN